MRTLIPLPFIPTVDVRLWRGTDRMDAMKIMGIPNGFEGKAIHVPSIFTKAEGDENMVEAMTSVYDVIDQDDEVIDAGAFDNPESRARVAAGMGKLVDT